VTSTRDLDNRDSLKGWIERVYAPGFAFGLRPEGWNGDLKGRIPLLKHDKVLIISTTLFDEAAYEVGLKDALKRLIDDFAFRYPGIKNVEHAYFYAVHGADDRTREEYLRTAYRLGKAYASNLISGPATTAQRKALDIFSTVPRVR
jgi:NAD(P)H dehydrogenase (quinone)